MQGGSVPMTSTHPALAPAQRGERLTPASDKEIDLVAVGLLLWARRWWLLLAIGLGTAIAAWHALRTPPTWRADVVTTEVHEQSAGGVSSLANQLSGLVNLTNLGVGVDRNER